MYRASAPTTGCRTRHCWTGPATATYSSTFSTTTESNLPLYPDFQAFFRKYQPPTLIVWGKNDKIFPAAGASPYLRDLPKADLHLLDTGHFALEDKLDVMAPMIHQFLDRSTGSK